MDVPASIAAQPRLLVSREALLHNIRVLRRSLSPETGILAVVKANAYGVGADIVADALTSYSLDELEAPVVDALAVATMDEASELSTTQIPVHILRPLENIFVGQHRQEIENALRVGHSFTVVSETAARDLSRIATAINRKALVHVMVDTGMCREGCPIPQLSQLADDLLSLPSIKLCAFATHFSSSEDSNAGVAAQQIKRFSMATDPIVQAHPHILRHAANSAAAFLHPAAHWDMIRPGLAILGIDPTCKPSIERPLRPVMRWTAPLLMVRDIKAGQSIGYNETFKAMRDMKIGLTPIGYADGYCRAFSNAASMMLHGKPVPVVGRVSMDYTTIDLTGIPDAAIGDEVTVMDSDPLSPASVYRLAEIAQTIPYELLTWIGARVKRVAVEPADQLTSEGATRAA